MENTHFPLDMYPIIATYLDWKTLKEGALTCWDLYYICNSEINKRIESEYPLGEKDALVKISLTSDKIKSINIAIFEGAVELPKDRYDMNWCQAILLNWFSRVENNWIQRYKLLKSIVQIINKENYPHDIETLIHRMELNFSVHPQENNNGYLTKLVSVEPLAA